MLRWVMAWWVCVGCGDAGKQEDTSAETWTTSSSPPTPSSSGTGTTTGTDTGTTTGTGTGTGTSTSTQEPSTTAWWEEACYWDACGGDPVGRWESVLHCADGKTPYEYGYVTAYTDTTTWSYYEPEYTHDTTWAYGECASAMVSQEEEFSLFLLIDVDRFNATYRYALTAGVTFPSECVMDPTCAASEERIGWAVDELCIEGCVEVSYGCVPLGDACACDVEVVTETGPPAGFPYSIDGTTMVLDAGGYELVYDYCVQDQGMMIYQVDDEVATVLR